MPTTVILPTPGLNTTKAQITFQGDPDSIRAQNFELLREKWPVIWPRIFAALKKVLDEYEYTYALTSNVPKLSVHLSEFERMNSRSEWSVLLEFEPFAGIYDVVVRGWSKIVDSGAAF